jgi:hypothetical protein
MKPGGVFLLAALAAGCGKKVEATPAADAAAKETPTSCLHARSARAYAWREEPRELAVDVELDWTCKAFAPDELELTDTEMGAKLGDPKKDERYRLDKDGALAEWDDPFLVERARAHGLLVYSYSAAQVPAAVGLRYGGVTILPSLPVAAGGPKPPPKPSMRIVATSSTPGHEKGTNDLTVLLELDNVPRSAGRRWKGPGDEVQRKFFMYMSGDARGSVRDGDFRHAERVLDVTESLAPIDTPVSSLPVRPAKRMMLAAIPATKMERADSVTLSTNELKLRATADGAGKLSLPKETRARLDAAPASADVEAANAP